VFSIAGNQFATSLLTEARFCKAGTRLFAINAFVSWYHIYNDIMM